MCPMIFVVEDDPAIRALAVDILSDAGYGVMVADTGAAAREILEAQHPQVILLDVRLPDTDGPTLAETIRAIPTMGQVPIIWMTAYSSLPRLPLDAHTTLLRKPFAVETFLQAIADALTHASRRATP